jgi:hypothetical protein
LKILRKVFIYLALAFAVVITSLVISAFLFKDKIINEFIREANKSLNTPVKIGKIDVSVFERFPHLSIVFTDVYIEDSHSGIYPLFTASSVSFQLNPFEVYRGIYNIKGLRVLGSETNLKINERGINNYTILKEKSDSDKTSIGFELKQVFIKSCKVHYIDFSINQEYTFQSEQLIASIQSKNDLYTIETDGDVTTEKVRIGSKSFFDGKIFQVLAHLTYNDLDKSLIIQPSTLKVRNSSFLVEGNYAWKDRKTISLKAKGEDADIQTILSLFPEEASQRLTKYKSKGEAYFTAELKGEISSTKTPSLLFAFGLSNTKLFHPEAKAELENISLEGSFATPSVTDLTKAVLILKNIRGSLNAEPFEAQLVVQNLIDSEVILDFKGKIDAAALTDFYPLKDITNVAGDLIANIAFEGRLSWLKSKATAQRASASGTVEIQNLNFNYGKENVRVSNLNGNLQFNNNDLALSNVSGELGNSDFNLNGFFKNIITFILFEDQPIGIEADLKSNFLDLDQLFALGFGDPTVKSESYQFSISKNVFLNFNCDVNALQYKRFKAHRVRGDLLVKNEMAVSRAITLKTMGGNLALSGIVDAKNPKAINVASSLKLDGLHIDSIFYVFENFHQHFIEDKHLKGRATADINLEMVLNQHLRLFQETLIADISTVIRNGELNNFEPMQKLSKYLDDESLHHLTFADLKNDIHIENKTVYIPQMIVTSNVTTIQISGTHTFDQQIDYRLITPLSNKRKMDTEARGAIETLDGQSKLFLKIIGTTDNYRILYDTEAVKKKIVADLKKEVQELKDAFKNKGLKRKKELELSEEEFDWDN